MKIGERLLLILMSLVSIVLLGLFAVAIWNTAVMQQLLVIIFASRLTQIISTGVALIIAILMLRLMFISTGSRKKKVCLAATTSSGEIYINLESISDLAQKAAKRSEYVKEVRVRTLMDKQGANIYVKVAFAPNAIIPTESALLQESIKKDIEDFCGIRVEKISIQVDNSLQ